MDRESSQRDAIDLLRRIVGKRIERVRLGIAPTLVIECGQKIPDPAGDQRYEWYLWLEHCSWRLEMGGRVVLAPNDEDESASSATLSALSSVAISDVVLSEPADDLVLVLSNGAVLRSFADRVVPATDVRWELFMPDNQVVTMSADGSLSRTRVWCP